MNLLHLDSSILGDASASHVLTAELVAKLGAASVTHRDLAATPIPHLTGADLSSTQNPVLDQFLAADTLVIGAPMYNFGIPSQLKSWIDRIVVAGKTFAYTAAGPKGLLEGMKKRIFIITTTGGIYSGTSMAMLDSHEAYLRNVFAFLGLTDVTFIRAEGVSLDRDAALAKGRAAIAAV